LIETVSIVAGGPSALKCGAARAPGTVIAVNDAFRHVRHDVVLTMDGRWLRYRIPGGELLKPLYARRSAWIKAGFAPALTSGGYGVRAHLYECDNNATEFGCDVDTLNGPNSGYVALNLAFVMRPVRVFLFGFDHKGAHFHAENEWTQRGEGCRNTPKKFARWADACVHARKQFDDAGIRVINTNHDSAIRAFIFGDAP
jgi:hypothetical protein